jgi:putative OPT family oligopeptide transporter
MTAKVAAQSESSRLELTLRGIVIGVLITFVFTAANVYLGLKVGLTIASSIPAAVISMTVLRALKRTTIFENNIVQTIASAAGAMSSVIFVLPGLVIIGAWTDFPFWTSFLICAFGGILGVMYTIPLRRALVTNSPLPYPEGVAAAEVLKVGFASREGAGAAESRQGFIAIVTGSVASAAVAALAGTRIMAGEVSQYVRVAGGGATGLGSSMSLALVGVGHLVGISVGMAMLVGLGITWGVAVPVLSHLTPIAGEAADAALKTWSGKVRFMGAGVISVAAIWTLIQLARPLWQGLGQAVAAQRARRSENAALLDRTERDMPIGLVALISLLCLPPLAWVLAHSLQGGPLESVTVPLVVASILYIAVAGFAVAAVCGYMAGLIGSSNSPVSGMAILSVLGAALIVVAIAMPILHGGPTRPLIALALLVTSALIAVAVSANDNLQDLKTGQLVEATPWVQQVALVIGVVAGSAVIPPVLDLLNHAYGFVGAPNLTAITSDPLAAPQATLISTLAKGVVDGTVNWSMIGVGAAIGVVLLVVDLLLRRTGRFSLPTLAVGLAIYLPSSVTVPVIVGALIGWSYDRYVGKKTWGEPARRLGVLLVSGLIVGESLFNVALAGLIVATGKAAPLGLVPEGFAPAPIVALAVCAIVLVGLYRHVLAKGQQVGETA